MSGAKTGNRFTATIYLGRVPAASDPRRTWSLTCGHVHRELRLADRCAARMQRQYPGFQVVMAARWVP